MPYQIAADISGPLAQLAAGLALPASLALTACGGASTDRPKTASVKPDNMPEGGSWTGVFYDAQFGMLHLVHHGSNVTGRWKRPNGAAWGELNGPVVGNVAHFEWTEHKVGLVGPSSITKGKGYFVGVPVVLGAKGMEKVVEIKMTADEGKLMAESVSHVKDLVGTVQKLFPELA